MTTAIDDRTIARWRLANQLLTGRGPGFDRRCGWPTGERQRERMTDPIERITGTDGPAFRKWLRANHDTAQAAWLVYYKKDSGTPSITWPQAVDEALCYGWIDSKAQSIDEDRYEQYFTKRKPTSVWSKVNKAKIAELQRENRLRPPGQAAIDAAKANGSWTILDDAQNHIVPDDLSKAFPSTAARATFDALSPSRRRNILSWIVLAKRAATRERRIRQTVDAAQNGGTPNNF